MARFLRDVGDVVGRDDADKGPAAVDDGEGVAVVAGHERNGVFLGLVAPERDEAAVHEVFDAGPWGRQQQGPQAHVVDEAALVVDDVDDVDGLGVPAVPADVVERFRDGPVWPETDVVGSHEAADAAGRVSEDGLGDLA